MVDKSRAQLEENRPLSRSSWHALFIDPILVLALAIVFSLDQVTKAVVRHNLLLGESVPSDGFIRITHTFNTGSAFGLFSGQTFFLILASFAGIGILLLVYRHNPVPSLLLRLSLGLQLGGALGNLIDRLRMGHVTDFVDVGSWPVFNVADASIVVGIVILASLFVLPGRGMGEQQRTAQAKVGAHLYSRSGDGAGRWSSRECPICDASMNDVPGGWRCSGCGVKEWVEEEQWPLT